MSSIRELQDCKTEINELECGVDDSIDDYLQPASISSTSVRQPSGNESDIFDEKLIEKQKTSDENVKPALLATPFAIQQTPQGYSLDIFFRAMCATVKTFPSPDIAEIKLKISQIVGTKEIEIINRGARWMLLL